MITQRTARLAPLAALPVLAIAALVVPATASSGGGNEVADFERVPADAVSPTGQTVIDDCQAPDNSDPEGWPDATASLKLRQRSGHSKVTIRVRDARPNSLYTVWLRLRGSDSNGDSYGGSPLTDIAGTPLVHTDDLAAMVATTGPGNGSAVQANGFTTNDRGNATFRTSLDFPIVDGAYPFHRFAEFDPTHPNLPGANPAVRPVAIPSTQAPFTLRVVTHCTDEVGHGLLPGPHELWFDWTVAS